MLFHHSRKRLNVFGDARFLFCPNLIKFSQIEPILPKKKLLGNTAAFPAPTSLISFHFGFSFCKHCSVVNLQFHS